MGFNYWLEKKKFDAEWEKTEKWYRECGMDDFAIAEMHEFDLEELRRRRIISIREVEFSMVETDDCEEKTVFELKKELSHNFCIEDEYHFEDGIERCFEDLENDNLRRLIDSLDDVDKHIMACLLMGFSQSAAAKIVGIARQNVNIHIRKIVRKYKEITGKH